MEGEEKSMGGAYWGVAMRACDACAAEAARLFCHTNAGCDTRAHGPGSCHARVWLCEVCEHAPATVTCKADAVVLYAACNADIHAANPLARRHERLPVAPFFGALADAPKSFASSGVAGAVGAQGVAVADDDESNNVEVASWLLPEPNQKDYAVGVNDVFFMDSDPYLDLDFARSMADIKAISVQLNGTPELDLTDDKLFYSDHSMNHSVSLSEAVVVLDAVAAGAAAVSVVSRGREREARLMRYREKRKSWRFEKTIWYAPRKAHAETRPRVKGWFAKRTGTPGAGADAEAKDALEEHEDMYSSAAAAVATLMAPGHGPDADYGVGGVVPTF